jgi:hypothetical protein
MIACLYQVQYISIIQGVQINRSDRTYIFKLTYRDMETLHGCSVAGYLVYIVQIG